MTASILTPGSAPIRIISISADAWDVTTRRPRATRRLRVSPVALVALTVIGVAAAALVVAVVVATVGAIGALADAGSSVPAAFDVAKPVGAIGAGG